MLASALEWKQITHRLSEWILLRDAERTVVTREPEQDQRLRLHARAADSRVTLAKELNAPAMMAIATELARQAVRHRVLAYGVAANVQDQSSVTALLERAGAAFGVPPEHLGAARQSLDQDSDSLALEQRSAEDLDRIRRELLDVQALLGAHVESRSLARLRSERVARCAGLALAAAFGLVLGYKAIFGAPNVAFHKPVTMSGGTPTSAANLVNGINDSREVDSLAEPDPVAWMDVDLGGVYAVEKVVITNRLDHAFDQSLPLSLEVSMDGHAYNQVELRRLHFTRWSASLHGMHASHVRVTSLAHAELGLNELEVFGRYTGR